MIVGHLRKMAVLLKAGQPVQYELRLGEEKLRLNDYLGRHITLRFNGVINCIACGRRTKKSFQQGYCFPCMRSLPECDNCIVRPETCHFHEGTCRDGPWALQHCFQKHVVYLANSSGVKVGITRQLPTRWIDQGAIQGLPLFAVDSRYQSGLLEVVFKNHVADRTDWRKMLRGDVPVVDLLQQRESLLALCAGQIEALRSRFGAVAIELLYEQNPVVIDYPVLHYPDKIRSLNLDKTPEIIGCLQGIKGQYLMLDSGVMNIRKHAGYCVEFVG